MSTGRTSASFIKQIKWCLVQQSEKKKWEQDMDENTFFAGMSERKRMRKMLWKQNWVQKI